MSGAKKVDGITFRIRHVMLQVSELERSIDFYTRLLGMDVQRIRPDPGRNQRTCYLGYGSEDENPGLELIETGGPGQVKEIPRWQGHIALYVSDVYGLAAKLRAAGVKLKLEPQPTQPGSQDHFAYVLDPDGHEVELSERHSRSGPPLAGHPAT